MNTTTRFALFLFAAFACIGGNLLAQNPTGKGKNNGSSNLLRPEYYAAIEFMEDGQFAQAATALETSLAQSRILNQQRGIDSIPAFVMLGECYFEQCEIGQALEKYDAALQLSIATTRWLSLLRSPAGAIRPDTRTRDITWLPNTRGTQMGTFPDGWPIALGSREMLLEYPAAGDAEGKLVMVDAMEILRCQAIALRRRYLLLGPLVQHNPITPLVADSFRRKMDGQPEPIVCTMNICRAIAELGMKNQPEAVRLLKQNLSLSSGLDHPLTPIALLMLADLAIESNEMIEAEDRANEAALASARAGQMGILAESIETISETGFVDGHDVSVAKTLPLIANWASKRSRLVTIRSQVEWTRLMALTGDVEGFRKQSTAATTMLLPKQISMPRAEAVLRYARSKIEFLEGKTSDAVSSLLESLAYLRGPTNGFGSAAQYQLSFAESLINDNAFSDEIAKSILETLLRSPSTGHWRVQPLEQLAWLLADKSNADRLLTDIAVRISNDSDLVTVFDHAVARRYRQYGALEARMMDLQLALHCRNPSWGVSDANKVAMVREQIPALGRNAERLQEIVSSLRQNPKWEMKNWNEEDSRKWDTAVKLSKVQESLLWAAAIGPLDIPELFPPRHDPAELSKATRPDDAIVKFVFHGDRLHGFLYYDQKWTTWLAKKPQELQQQIDQYRTNLMQLKSKPITRPSLEGFWSVQQRWDLKNSLFPDAIWEKLALARRWIVIPDGDLWNFPFESLPEANQPDALPAVASHRIVFSPTLGLVPKICQVKRKQNVGNTAVVVSSEFVSPNPLRAKQLKSDISMEARQGLIDLSSKTGSYPASRYLRVVADEVCSYSSFPVVSVSPIPTDASPEKSMIGSWRELPWSSPARLLLPGLDMVHSQATDPGEELFKLVMPLIANETQQILLSRFPVGGESTVAMLRAFQQNSQEMAASEAYQRSVLALWEEQLEIGSEIVFSGVAAEDPAAVVPGNHPLLWSGYMLIGDSE